MQRVLAALALVMAPTPAWADDLGGEGIRDELAEPLAPSISPDLLDPEGRTRFHLTGRFTPGKRDTVWTLEATGAVNIVEGVALTFGLPVGFDLPKLAADPPRDDTPFFGNLRLGTALGFRVRLGESWDKPGTPTLVFGGALDAYLPTRPAFDPNPSAACTASPAACDPASIVLTARSLEPGLYFAGSAGFRARVQVAFHVSVVSLQGEIGVTPMFTLTDSTDAYMWLGVAGRVRVVPLPWLEPYFEIGAPLAVVEPRAGAAPKTPLMLTPGVRLHFAGVDPAVFVHLAPSSDAPSTVTVGFDLAGVVRREARAREDKDFLDF